MTARLAALNVLLAVERGRTTLAAELDRARRGLRDERDRALLSELTAGSLRWQARLDALIAQCSDRPADKLTPGVRTILRLSAYQLEHLDRIPAHAVLNEAVELTRQIGEPRAAGFVNAVLRTFGRRRARLKLPARPDTDAKPAARVAYLSTTLSHPAWLVERWMSRYGFEAAERWCEFNNSTPSVTVRSRGRLSAAELLMSLRAAEIDAAAATFVRDAIVLPPGTLGHVPAPLAEEFFVQDEASQLVAHAVGAAPGQRVLDVCAAPGGKTIVLAADLQKRGLLVASDYRASRVRLLHRTVRQAGASAYVVAFDATSPLPFRVCFDRVFVDAPCSGLGIVRRDPDLKWSRQPDDLPGFALVQHRMLTQAAEVVVPGGRLVYATCTSEPEENDFVVRRFLEDDRRFAVAPISPELIGQGTAPLVDSQGFLRTLPFRDGLDAFFAASLARVDAP